MKEPGYNSHLILECEEIEDCVETYRASAIIPSFSWEGTVPSDMKILNTLDI